MPVEVTDGIRAIRDTHTNADATGIDLLYDPFRVKMSGVDGTDFGTGRFITLHTGHGNEAHLHMRVGSFDFMDEIHPEFCPPQFGFFVSREGDVILLPAGHHAGLTACAFIQIDYHPPAVHLSTSWHSAQH
jgi:hypothetical protein